MRRITKWTAAILVIVMSLTLAACGGTTQSNNETTAPPADTHEHCVCGGHWTGNTEYHTCQSVTGWTALTNTTMALMTELTTGNYYLAEDIQLLDNLSLVDGATVTLCLNGHALMGADSTTERVFEQAEASTLNITDCSEKQTGIIASANDVLDDTGGLYLMNHKEAVLNLYSGTLLGRETTKSGGILRMESAGGTVNMYGGRMTGGVAGTHGGNVYMPVAGMFNLYGGVIDGGTASGKGGNVFLGGVMNLYGGAIVKGNGANTEDIYIEYGNMSVYNLDAGTTFLRARGRTNVRSMDSSLTLAEIPSSIDNLFATNFYSLTKAGVTELELPTVTKPTV